MSDFEQTLPEAIIKYMEEPRKEYGQQENPRFAYYTTADTAYKIISNNEIWMRNASLMNDYSEIRYGMNLIEKSFGRNSDFKHRLNSISEKLDFDLFDNFANAFDEWETDLKTNTYLTCISKHDDSEDDYGRLSMWRAYGGRNGIALILDAEPMFRETDNLKIYSGPVLYWDEITAKKHFSEMIIPVLDAFDSTAPDKWTRIQQIVAYYLRMYCLSLKHPGFAEEKEWRIFYRPNEAVSDFVKTEIETIQGVPQTVQKLSLAGEENISISNILKRVIIGPCDHQYQIAKTISVALQNSGIENPWEILKVSSIPLRH